MMVEYNMIKCTNSWQLFRCIYLNESTYFKNIQTLWEEAKFAENIYQTIIVKRYLSC